MFACHNKIASGCFDLRNCVVGSQCRLLLSLPRGTPQITRDALFQQAPEIWTLAVKEETISEMNASLFRKRVIATTTARIAALRQLHIWLIPRFLESVELLKYQMTPASPSLHTLYPKLCLCSPSGLDDCSLLGVSPWAPTCRAFPILLWEVVKATSTCRHCVLSNESWPTKREKSCYQGNKLSPWETVSYIFLLFVENWCNFQQCVVLISSAVMSNDTLIHLCAGG